VTIILVIRIIIVLTFLILVFIGPITFLQLRAFIKVYMKRHIALMERVAHLEEVTKHHDTH
jgi:hypothetical protein